MGSVNFRLEERLGQGNTASVITELGIGNFKAFGEIQRVPIKPLTLIFGANSSGKSSIIHGLLLARHALDTGQLDVAKTKIGGDSVDLGGIRQYVHRGETRRCIEFTLGWVPLRCRRACLSRFQMGRTGCRCVGGLPTGPTDMTGVWRTCPLDRWALSQLKFQAHETIVWQLCRDGSGRLAFEHLSPFLDKADQKTTQKLNALSKAFNLDATVVDEALPGAVGKLRFSVENFLPLKLAASLDSALLGSPEDEATRDFESLVERLVTPRLEEAVIGVARAAADGLQRLRYLGPLRCYPMRHFFFLLQARDENWIAGGGYAGGELVPNSDVRERVNAWLSSDRLQTKISAFP